jgi:hypothetical protein
MALKRLFAAKMLKSQHHSASTKGTAMVTEAGRCHTLYPRLPIWRCRPPKRRPRIKPEADLLTADLVSFILPNRLASKQ